MRIIDYFKSKQKSQSASLAKERLQIIVAHQRSRNQVEFLPKLQRELLDVIRKYVPVADDQVRVQLDDSGECSVLELNIALPEAANRAAETA